jgi:hypothetical protein
MTGIFLVLCFIVIELVVASDTFAMNSAQPNQRVSIKGEQGEWKSIALKSESFDFLNGDEKCSRLELLFVVEVNWLFFAFMAESAIQSAGAPSGALSSEVRAGIRSNRFIDCVPFRQPCMTDSLSNTSGIYLSFL